MSRVKAAVTKCRANETAERAQERRRKNSLAMKIETLYGFAGISITDVQYQRHPFPLSELY